MGWAQMLRGQYDDALFTYYKVLAKSPDNPLARVNLGYICLKKGIFGEAIEHLSRAIRQEQDRKASLYAHFYMGLVYLEREMYDDARAFLRKTLELGPNLLEAWYEMGHTFYLEGNRHAAAEAWRHGVEANRFSVWGERCGEALKQVEAGAPVQFARSWVDETSMTRSSTALRRRCVSPAPHSSRSSTPTPFRTDARHRTSSTIRR